MKQDLSIFSQFVQSADIHFLKRMRAILQNKIAEESSIRTYPLGEYDNDLSKRKFTLHHLLNEDWSGFFQKYDSSNTDSYVYLHVDPRTKPKPYKYNNKNNSFKMPFYIGMGINHRIYSLNRSTMHRKTIESFFEDGYGKEEIMIFFKTGLSESAAREIESKLILFFGIRTAITEKNIKRNKKALSGQPPVLLNSQYEGMPEKYLDVAYFK